MRQASPAVGWEGPRGEGWVAVQALLILLYLWVPSIGAAWPRPIRLCGGLPLAAGVARLATGGAALGRQLTPLPRPAPAARLVTGGAYGPVRHPIYAGLTLAALGLALLTASPPRLVIALLLAAFFEAKARREEAWLLEHDREYAAYRARVRRFIPGLY
jgi:protein-S-isoprenylcysteine O-methyltransferase Ste14